MDSTNDVNNIVVKAKAFTTTAKESLESDFNTGGVKLLIKNKYFIGATLAFLFFLFLAMSGNSTPMGDDSSVKSLVIEISTEELKRQVTPLMYAKITSVPVGLIGLKVTYEGLVSKINQERNREVVEAIDEAMEKMELSLTNIRTENIQDELKKSTSAADLIVNGESNPITYTAQINGDGDLYVEVYGLN